MAAPPRILSQTQASLSQTQARLSRFLGRFDNPEPLTPRLFLFIIEKRSTRWEWGAFIFYDERGSLYLAAIFHLSDQGKQFTIITRPAAGCMVGIHDRMPLILEKEDIEGWLFSKKAACKLLENCFGQLHRRKSDIELYQQLSLFC